MTSDANHPLSGGERRIIKRYSNRKLYDTKESRYVTLAQIAELVRAGEDVQVIDNATKADKTEATLALIISEEVKARPKAVPLNTLRELVHAQGEKIMSQLRESPIARLFPQPLGESEPDSGVAAADRRGGDAPSLEPSADSRTPVQRVVESSRQTIEQWQAAIDERIAMLLPGFFRDQQDEVKRLRERVTALEQKVRALGAEESQSLEDGE